MRTEAPDGPQVDHCYLHIGTEKTGTTSIQHYLAANREALRGAGYLYPTSLNSPNHMALARYALDDDRVGDLRKTIGVEGAKAVERYRDRIAKSLREEIAEEPQPHTLVLSNEHCHSQLTSESEVARLAELLKSIARQITVIVYLRPQHELALSKFSTHIKMGGRGVNPFPKTRDGLPPYYDYEALTDRWASQFGPENLQVRLFERSSMPNGSLLDDISAVIGLDSSSLVAPPKQNESLSPEGLALLRALNEHIPRFVEGKRNPLHTSLVRQMERTFPGKGLQVGRKRAAAFQAAFESGNEAVRARYFPERDRLFHVDWGRFPEDPPGRLDQIELSKAFADLWTACAQASPRQQGNVT